MWTKLLCVLADFLLGYSLYIVPHQVGWCVYFAPQCLAPSSVLEDKYIAGRDKAKKNTEICSY